MTLAFVFFIDPIGASVFVFSIDPIGASGIDAGCKPGANPSTTPFFERGLHLRFSRWLYQTRSTLIGKPQTHPGLVLVPRVARAHNRGTQTDSIQDHWVGTSCSRRESSMGMN